MGLLARRDDDEMRQLLMLVELSCTQYAVPVGINVTKGLWARRDKGA